MVSDLITRNLIDQLEHLGRGLQTIVSSAGLAPADAWQPLGPEMHRSTDLWVAFPETDWEQRTAELVPGTDEGLRLRVVQPELEGQDLLEQIRPILESLPSDDYRYLHAELMQGPEAGVFLAVDNRLPALLTQLHVSQPVVLEDEFPELPPGAAVHLNLVMHNEAEPVTAWFGEGGLANEIETVAGYLAAHDNPVHQLSVGRLVDPRGGYCLGLECVGDERGSQGGFRP